MINILLGWPFAGWAVALAMALRSVRPGPPAVPVVQNLLPAPPAASGRMAVTGPASAPRHAAGRAAPRPGRAARVVLAGALTAALAAAAAALTLAAAPARPPARPAAVLTAVPAPVLLTARTSPSPPAARPRQPCRARPPQAAAAVPAADSWTSAARSGSDQLLVRGPSP